MKNVFKLYPLVLLLLTQEVCTKSISSEEGKKYSKRAENEQENTELHETYKSKHKYKSENDHVETKRHSGKYENSEWRPQCAVMYKNNEPVGILQPFEDAFKFRPLNLESTIVDLNPIPAKRRTIMDVLYPSKFEEDYEEEKAVDVINKRDARADRNYALALAKFKINSRVGLNRMNRKTQEKRSKEMDEQHLRSLRNTLKKRKTDDSEAVEVELASILDDMGLIDDSPDEKREAEDENMESGSNAISMVKDEPTSTAEEQTKAKRDEVETPSTTSTVATSSIKLTEVSDLKENKEQKREMTETSTSTKISTAKDQKREAAKIAADKQDADEVSVYEKRVEREIRDKIQRLKEEVKKEIAALKLAKAEHSDPNRKKRDVLNTLMDEETKDIDPVANYDGTEKKHVRRKRNAQLEKRYSSAKGNSNETLDRGNIIKCATKDPDLRKKWYPSSKGKLNTVGLRIKVIRDAETLKKLSHSLLVEQPEYLSIVDRHKRTAPGKDNSHKVNDLDIDKGQQMLVGHTRRKREADYEENEYDEAYDEFADDSNTLNENKDMTSSAQENPNCKCDKNGNNCKCRRHVKNADYSNFIVDPERIIRSAIISSQHCHCDKNHNCKCGVQEEESALEDSRRQRREGSSYQDQYQLMKREAKIDSNFQSGEYFVDLHPTVYRLAPDDSIRSKREMADQQKESSSSLAEEPQMINQHSRSIRDEPLHSRIRRTASQDSEDDQRQLIDMSEEEIFGALPQSMDPTENVVLAKNSRTKKYLVFTMVQTPVSSTYA
nr:unnamed protein product [Callosobruchus analis]